MKEEFLKINGLNSNIKIFWKNNSWEVFLILHWWWGSSDSWIQFSKMLENDWYKVIVPDLPWHWKTELNKVFDLDNYWDFVLDIIKELKLKNLNIIAHSNWWRITLNLLINKKVNPKNIFLVWSAWIRPKLTIKQKFFKLLAKTFWFLKKIPWISFLRNIFYRIIWWHDYLKTDDNKFLKQTFLNVLEVDLSDKLHLIKNKIELIWWDKDTYTPLYLWRKMSIMIWNANLTILKWQKHWIHLQNPRLLYETIKKLK